MAALGAERGWADAMLAAGGGPPRPASASAPGEELRGLHRAIDEHAIVAVTDRAGVILYVNDQFCRISGYGRRDLVGHTHRVVNSGRHPPSFFARMWSTIARGRRWRGEICNRTSGGDLYWVDTTIVPLRAPDGRIDRYLSVRFDITERRTAEIELAREHARRISAEQLLRDVLDAVPVGLTALDAEDRLLIHNAELSRQYRALAPELLRDGTRYQDFVDALVTQGHFTAGGEREVCSWLERRSRRRASVKPVSVELSDGRWMQLREYRSPGGLSVIARTDITELKRAERTIRKQAEEDSLTGLANRSIIIAKVDEALANPHAGPCALVLIDLDDFKAVNDSLGHDAGDELLIVVGRRLAAALPRRATVGRMGGDEFAIVVTGADEGTVAGRLHRVLRAVQKPVALTGRSVTPRLSLGAATFAPGAASRREIFHQADVALYHAKASGRGRFAFFDEDMLAAEQNRRRLGDDLRQAIENREISIDLQPQWHLATGRHAGFEVLARWHRGSGSVPPAEFIPLAEETGLIIALGSLVLERAFAFLADLPARGLDPGRVAINISAAQLKLDDFADTLASLIAVHGLRPSQIEVEVTETMLLDRSGEQIARTLSRLHELGIAISLDDFGTGYASLAHLKRFHVDRLKIDRSFVADLGADDDRAVIPRTIISLAHSLGMDVVAEGIETEEQLRFLKACHCDVGQGYLRARPMPPACAEAYLRRIGEVSRSRPGEAAACRRSVP
jgi:two-component system CheB/CheR fusion protein